MIYILQYPKMSIIFPGIEKITEQETAHPSLHQLSQLTGAASKATNSAMENITVSHEIEERAIALAQLDDDDEDDANSEEAVKESVDQTAFQGEPGITDVPAPLVTVVFSHLKLKYYKGNLNESSQWFSQTVELDYLLANLAFEKFVRDLVHEKKKFTLT